MIKIEFYIRNSVQETFVFTIKCDEEDAGHLIQMFIDGRDGFDIITITVYPT